MANLDPVLPEIIGRPPRGGMRSDRPVRMAQPDYSGVSEAIGNLADAGVRLHAGFRAVKQKEEELLFTERWNAFVTETQKGLQGEIFSLKGGALTGAEERMVALVKKASATHSKGFSPEMARRWNAKVHAYANSSAPSVMRYRDQELSKSQLEAYSVEQKGYMAAYLATGDLTSLDQGVEALRKAFRLTRGNVIPAENVRELYADIHDGDGKVKLPGGGVLHIGKDITMEEALEEYARIKSISDEYELARQQYLDSACAAMVDQYVKAADYGKLKDFLGTINTPGGIQVSPEVHKVIKREATLALEVHDDRAGAEFALKGIETQSGEDAPYYAMTQEASQKVTVAIAELEKKGDPRSLRQAEFLREAFKREYKAQEAKLTSAATAAAKKLVGDPETAARLREKTDLLSRKTLDIYTAYLNGKDEALKKDPKYAAYRQGMMLLLQGAMDNGESTVAVTLGGTPSSYSLRGTPNGKDVPPYDPNKVVEIALSLGLTQEDAAKLGEYAVKANSGDVIRISDVYEVLRKEGFKNPEAFVLIYGQNIMFHMATWDKKGDKSAWVRSRVNGLIRDLIRKENRGHYHWDWATPEERLRFYQSTGTPTEGWSSTYLDALRDPEKKYDLWRKMLERGGTSYRVHTTAELERGEWRYSIDDHEYVGKGKGTRE